MPPEFEQEGRLVLICAPFGSDGANVARLAERAGYSAATFDRIEVLAARLDDGVGMVVVTEEGLAGDLRFLRQALEEQPSWSDIPVLLLVSKNIHRPGAADAARISVRGLANNLVVLERPLGSTSLISAIDSALRSRQRQFQTRDHIAELVKSRRDLAESEAELKRIADALPVLIGFVGSDLRYRFANRAYLDWFGQEPEAVLGRHVREVAGEEAFAARWPSMERALAGHEARLQLSWPHADGRRREADIRYLPRHDASGAVDGFHVFVMDVTERVMGEEALRQTAEQLEERVAERTRELQAEVESRAQTEAALRQSQKMEAVGQLTGGIAHDFNNMLTGIIGAHDMIRRRRAAGRDDDIDRYMDAASASAARAAALTERLLAFSRRQTLDPKAVDANQLIASLLDLLLRTVGEHIQVEVALEADRPLVVDANQLESAILNLCINARDAMPTGGTLRIETALVDDSGDESGMPQSYVRIAVLDTGVGMAPEVLDRVFEPFFTTKPIGQGTGLGLSMVYGFAKQSGGQVRIFSSPGGGATVELLLPVAQAVEAAAAPTKRLSDHDGGGKSVLLVEDDPSVRLLVRDLLIELGYAVMEAAEPQAAIAHLRSPEPVDFMVSDVGLPGMNGRQLAEVARQYRPELPILFVTGYAENAAIRSSFLGTNMDMIAKPFDLNTLGGKIAELTGAQNG
ncbi:PAS domain-containing protein [Caulobacter sp. NIBR2454]|uniref:PAS domain-containing protein n=1 Tax=Caulobacter sp. NIBR2454 TaxID=3015996 RepID=UPI0022B74C37|nr:PAS domain-containing protein [Caulobacter sp. NIBR2454]